MGRKTKNNPDKILYGDITNRMFAFAVDLAILYFPLNYITNIGLRYFFAVQNQFAATSAQIFKANPQAEQNFGLLISIMSQYYPHDLVIIIRQLIFVTVVQGFILALYVIPLIYKYGATPGKMLVGLHVTDIITGGRISLSQSIIRYLAYIPSCLIFGMGLFFGGMRRDKRCWHDFLADTAVVYAPDRWYLKYTKRLITKIRKFFNL